MAAASAVVVARQQAGAEPGIADAPAGIDARADQEAEVIGARRAVEPRDVHQGAKARPRAPAHHLEAARHKGAVEAD